VGREIEVNDLAGLCHLIRKAYRFMAKFILKKGTIVKHGTSLARIADILRTGLVPGAERNADRSTIELAPEISGVYVGELTAYFGAYANFAAEIAGCLDDPRMLRAAISAMVSPTDIRNLNLPASPMAFPLVIAIELQEECELLADEDYVLDGAYPLDQRVPSDLLESEAELVWHRWRSGVITRAIPPSWFKHLEHPRLTHLDGSLELHRQTWSDCELFAASLMQSTNKELPEKLIPPYVRRYGELALSQRIAPTLAAVDRLIAHKGLAVEHNRVFNHLRIYHLMDEMAREYGIRMVRSIGDQLVLR
jgi:hypothetical protein